jgi:hypothetical protein
VAVNRIKFADDAGGTNTYICQYNPVDIDVPTDEIAITTVHKIVDGSNIRITGSDNYTYKLIWRGWSHSSISTMISELVSYIYEPSTDNTKFIHFQDLGTTLGIFSTFTEIKVVDVIKKIRPGTAYIYDELTLLFEKVL